ncbi:uncharacterized protein LOC133530973 isoform X1 [Cydia pomonella]|uniref:uncharacterized protein LOC133530973 isoform X1 n=1 Tax=Cydia pomonella TaxID=82600 RepID=UPI002ADD9E51|nr:uncharacterized protein LOC133530973 isoform X1 [Cydia pomonella]
MPKPTKLHAKKKPTSIQKSVNVDNESSAGADPEESLRQFQLELCWCIQQLEKTLAENKGNERQLTEAWKVVNVLKNNSQPIIRKRQLMRTHFGDYRVKMAAEEKKLAKIFSLLRSEQKDANKTDEKEYPWIARVVHSPDKDHPYLCTAACIEDRIFVTAARCIYQAKVSFTTVINQGSRLRPRAFVVPSKPTKQMFDDIGFIVVSKTNHTWNAVKVFDKQDNEMFTRTDENYFWLSKMGEIEGTAVGFVNGDQKQSGTLYQANVYISPFICQHFYNTEILQEPKYYSDHYFVPCFHTCDLMDGYSRYKCNRRLAGEGHVILEEKSKKLIGIATWGGYFAKSIGINLPVGMAVLNSDNFQEDLECARMIKNAPVTSKTFSNLCK